jgi:phosphate transport system protein
VAVMRTTFHTELDELSTDLARMARLTAQMMTTASTALHHNDLALAGVVIADGDQLTVILDDTERRCVTLLALQAPVAGDLRGVVAAIRTVDHLTRMGKLARHIARIARRQHPKPMVSGEVRPICARMGLRANQLAEAAATAIEHRDPLAGDRLAAPTTRSTRCAGTSSTSCSPPTGHTACNRQSTPPYWAATTSASPTTRPP